MAAALGAAALMAAGAGSARAYPEFQAQVAKSSGRSVNCALCHAHPDGPDGAGYGQIGRLNVEETERLNRARKAIEPGAEVNSPLLNEFGNSLVHTLGMRRILELKVTPAELANAIDPASDLDRDGITDAQELRDGTHPLKKEDGRPWLLFANNFRRNFSTIALTAAATIAGLYGLIHLLHGFASATRGSRAEDDDED
jgi:hypothetical protein